jgi:hypothetical protein
MRVVLCGRLARGQNSDAETLETYRPLHRPPQALFPRDASISSTRCIYGLVPKTRLRRLRSSGNRQNKRECTAIARDRIAPVLSCAKVTAVAPERFIPYDRYGSVAADLRAIQCKSGPDQVRKTPKKSGAYLPSPEMISDRCRHRRLKRKAGDAF